METIPPYNAELICPLTKAEIEVLQTARDNATTKDPLIAEILVKSPSTVENQWKDIKQKLSVYERYAAICLAEDNGWIVKNTRIITRSGGGVNSYLLSMPCHCFH